MRRSICYVEPKFASTGSRGHWRFIFSPSTPLMKGGKLRFDLHTKGREIDWELPTLKENDFTLSLPNGKSVAPKKVGGEFSSLYEFVLPSEIGAGEEMVFVLGSDAKPLRAQTYVQRRRTFTLFIDAKGKGDFKESEPFQLDIRGNELSVIRVITPSLVNKNERFDVVVRFEDAFGNLTGRAPEGTLIELSYDQLRENISWKLFVPETGFITLPNLYFNEAGTYKLRLKNLKSGEAFYSSPIRCQAESPNSLYWGAFRGEMELYDANENIESCLRHVRDDQSYQFYAVSPFEGEKETSNDAWKQISHYVSEFNEDERFVTLLGFQWQGQEGLRHLIYPKDNRPILRKKDTKYNSLKKIFKAHTPKEILSIPCFTMADGTVMDFEHHTPEFEPVIEIYNAWGSSECLEKEGNSRPITSKKGFNETPIGSLRDALNRNHRFGFVAGGYDDRGLFEGLYDTDQAQYTPGLTAILSPAHTRDSLVQALHRRSCFATTGERMLIGFEIAQSPMGCELNTQAKPGLAYNRHIQGHAVGTEPLTQVTLFRNGTPLISWQPEGDRFEFTYDDMESIDDILLTPTDGKSSFVYYYLRAEQADGHMAWASPIWVDHIIDKEQVAARKKAKKART